MGRKSRVPAVALALSLALPGCRDMVTVYSHPPGAELVVDGRNFGAVPETGLPVDVKWWTFSDHRVRLTWPGGASLSAELRKSFGEPDHPEYLVVDGVLALFFLVPGVVAFCVNGYGPEPQQHFYSPAAPPPQKPLATPPPPARVDPPRPKPAVPETVPEGL